MRTIAIVRFGINHLSENALWPPREDKTHPSSVRFLSQGLLIEAKYTLPSLPSPFSTPDIPDIPDILIPPNALILASGAYQDALAHWKDADPDIPMLKPAKAEHEKLK